MAQPEHTPPLALLEEAVTVLFCRIDDAYYRLNPRGDRYASLKELSDSEVLALALFQQLRGIESPNTLSCARPPASSPIFSRASWAIGRPPSTVACASSGVSSNPCDARSCPSW